MLVLVFGVWLQPSNKGWHGHCCATAGFSSCSNCSRHACQAHPSSAAAELARSISSQHELSLFLLTGSTPLTLFTSTMHVALFMQACPKEHTWPYSHAVVSVSPQCKPLSASLQWLFFLFSFLNALEARALLSSPSTFSLSDSTVLQLAVDDAVTVYHLLPRHLRGEPQRGRNA